MGNKKIVNDKNFYRCPKPKCKSYMVWRYGYDIISDKKTQKFKCKKCGHVWREK